MNDPYKKFGREAHPGHLNKVGQAWKEDTVQVFVEDPTRKEHRIFDMPEGNRKCERCGEVIRYDERGVAFCQCPSGNIWNEAVPKTISPLAKIMRLERLKNFCKG